LADQRWPVRRPRRPGQAQARAAVRIRRTQGPGLHRGLLSTTDRGPSMITILIAAAWLVGVTAAAWRAPGGAPAAALAAGTLGWLLLRRDPRRAACLGAVCSGVALLGVARWQAVAAPPSPDHVAVLIDAGRIGLRGVVREDAEDRGRTARFKVDVKAVNAGGAWRAAAGGVLARVAGNQQVRAGDKVELFGTVSEPPVIAGFDYRGYLARQGIEATVEYPALRVTGHDALPAPALLIARLRRSLRASLDRALSHPESALATGIVVGDRSAMPADLVD